MDALDGVRYRAPYESIKGGLTKQKAINNQQTIGAFSIPPVHMLWPHLTRQTLNPIWKKKFFSHLFAST